MSDGTNRRGPRAAPRFDPKASRTVLVVDDHVEIRDLLTEYLGRLGLVPLPAPDGRQAIVICEKVDPRIILLDLRLPDVTGTTLISEFKARRPETPIIVISGYLDDGRDAECRARGADEVLAKPVNLQQLARLVFRLLGLPLPRLLRPAG